MVELWRGPLCESVHAGHAVVCDARGQVVRAWGDADAVIFPRSSVKMIQALPMVEAGLPLSTDRLALACSSHRGAAKHVAKVQAWLDALELGDGDLLCGTEASRDRETRHRMIRDGVAPRQVHNQCSGKHVGFLAYTQHLKAGRDYVQPDHPVQRAIHAAQDELTGIDSPAFGFDGCAAPNFATTVTGLGRAMAAFAAARDGQGARGTAMAALRDAMCLHPDLVGGEADPATDLMRAMDGRVAAKSGAEGVFVAILPEKRLGVAVKIVDGADRAAAQAVAAILAELGVLDRAHPTAQTMLDTPIVNRAGAQVGRMRPAPGFPS